MKKLLFLLFSITPTIITNAYAQDIDSNVVQVPDLLQEVSSDSMLNSWYMTQHDALTASDEELIIQSENDIYIPQFSDSVYIDRINRMQSYIPLTYNSIVRNYIHVYTEKKHEKLSEILGLRDYYFPIFEEVLDLYGLPNELKYLPVIESALNPNAVSKANAVGLWQFIFSTGKMYNLTINSYIDDRRDPIKASHAAAHFLSDLYKIYHDWNLVIAAYNCGPGNVNKAIRRSGGKKDYWDIYYFLPKETRGYVPAFIAAMYAMNYYPEHNIRPLKIEMPISTDTIMVTSNIHLRQISEVLLIPYADLKILNPQYRIDIIPGKYKPQSLRLPVGYTEEFITLHDSIVNFKDSIFIKDQELVRDPLKFIATSYSPTAPAGHSRVYYTVRSGDNLGAIANRHRVTVASLKSWNNLRSNMIRTGQKLIVYQPAKTKNTASTQPKVTKETETAKKENIVYTVRPGDTVWSIAQKYPDVKPSDILKRNNLSENHTIVEGQRLKIK